MSAPASLNHRRTNAALLRLGIILVAIARSSAANESPPDNEKAAEGESAARKGRKHGGGDPHHQPV
jgi:hypothetical protein